VKKKKRRREEGEEMRSKMNYNGKKDNKSEEEK
jgi:hypothetical protein